jgi:hypothetical protein
VVPSPAATDKPDRAPEPAVASTDAGYSGFRRSGISFRRRSEETSCAEPGRLVVALLLNERTILGRIVQSLEYRRQRNFILPGKFFRCERIRTMDGLVDDRRSDPSTFEE